MALADPHLGICGEEGVPFPYLYRNAERPPPEVERLPTKAAKGGRRQEKN
jgi:hypothetical protein